MAMWNAEAQDVIVIIQEFGHYWEKKNSVRAGNLDEVKGHILVIDLSIITKPPTPFKKNLNIKASSMLSI